MIVFFMAPGPPKCLPYFGPKVQKQTKNGTHPLLTNKGAQRLECDSVKKA